MPSIFSFNFRLQLFALFLAVLEVFFPPPYPPHRPAHSARQITLMPFFKVFGVFLASEILLFFRLATLLIFGASGLAKGLQNQAKIVKNLSRG